MFKTLLYLLFFGQLTIISFGQDLIVTLKNDSIFSRVYGVDSIEIRYRPVDFLDGPVRVMLRADVYLIKYQDGSIDSINTSIDITAPFDLIVKVNGDSIMAKVEEISEEEIKYRDITFFDGPRRVLAREDIYLIRYANGKVEMMREDSAGHYLDSHSATYERGEEDAVANYTGYRDAGTITIISTLLFPPFGLIPAIACSSTPPNDKHLHYPSETKMKKDKYREGYTDKAWKIKKGRVWTNFGIGTAIWVVIILAGV